MKTRKALLFSAAAIVIALAIFLIRSHRPLPDESARLEAEREIYALLISDFLGEEDIVDFPSQNIQPWESMVEQGIFSPRSLIPES